MHILKARKGNIGVGGAVLGLIVAMVTIMIGLLLGGILSSQINEQFSSFNVTQQWTSLFTNVQNITTSAISIAVVAFLVVAFMLILGALGVFNRSR